MHAELVLERPLFEFAVILVVIGLAGFLASRDLASRRLSQGLVAIGLLTGFGGADEMHQASKPSEETAPSSRYPQIGDWDRGATGDHEES